MQGRIVENISNRYRIENQNKEIYEATARGRLRKEETLPVVGDIVEFEITELEKKEAVINQVQERKVYIKRPKLANITQIVLVISSKNPKPDLLMLDKQLIFAEFLGVKALIVLNKTDLDDKNQLNEIKQTYEKIGYSVVETQAKNQKGIKELKEKLKNNINAFSGNSGVGKSTLINAIFNQNRAQEGEISKKNQKGKNTTTSIRLYEIDQNTYIADTPGFSSFSIEEIKSKDLANYFIEFKGKTSECEFMGCMHRKEKNCGIKQAVERGEISQARYERFCKIQEQLKQREEQKRW